MRTRRTRTVQDESLVANHRADHHFFPLRHRYDRHGSRIKVVDARSPPIGGDDVEH